MLKDDQQVDEDNLILSVRGAKITVTPEDIKEHLKLHGVPSSDQAARIALRDIESRLKESAGAHPNSGNPPMVDVKRDIGNALYDAGITVTCDKCGKTINECSGHRFWHPWDTRPL